MTRGISVISCFRANFRTRTFNHRGSYPTNSFPFNTQVSLQPPVLPSHSFFWLRGLAYSHLFPILLLEKVSPQKLWNHAKRAGSKERRVTVRMLADLAFGLLAERFSIPKKGSRRKFFRGDGCPPFFFLLCANNISGEKVRGWC